MKKNMKIVLMAAVIMVIALVVIITFSGYKKAQEKVKELEEVERLSDPIAIYEEASREVDISKVTAEVNQFNKGIVVHIPTAKILSHEIDDESIETLDEKMVCLTNSKLMISESLMALARMPWNRVLLKIASWIRLWKMQRK